MATAAKYGICNYVLMSIAHVALKRADSRNGKSVGATPSTYETTLAAYYIMSFKSDHVCTRWSTRQTAACRRLAWPSCRLVSISVIHIVRSSTQSKLTLRFRDKIRCVSIFCSGNVCFNVKRTSSKNNMKRYNGDVILYRG